MTGTIAIDQTKPAVPAVPARRSVLLSFTQDDLALALTDHVTSLLGFHPASVKANVKFRGDVLVEIDYDLPAATPASSDAIRTMVDRLAENYGGSATHCPRTPDLAKLAVVPTSAPPLPAPGWFEFPVTESESGDDSTWGYGSTEREAYLDVLARREGEPGKVNRYSLQSLDDCPVNVTPLHYAFAVPGHAIPRVGHGCTPQEAWGDVVGREPALAHLKHEVVNKGRLLLQSSTPMPGEG